MLLLRRTLLRSIILVVTFEAFHCFKDLLDPRIRSLVPRDDKQEVELFACDFKF
jgi:hypothetical protein